MVFNQKAVNNRTIINKEKRPVNSEIRRPDVETMISQGFKNRLKGLTVKYNPQDDHHIDFEKMNEQASSAKSYIGYERRFLISHSLFRRPGTGPAEPY